MSRVELLAPAGDMECFKAAIIAGADAVYLAGKEFGARASATNFTTEEIVDAINYAHLYGRKVFLTLNTLIKEREWSRIYGFLKPLYEEGLDGIIIQDLGLIGYLSDSFPSLELHASTQMTVTNYRSALLLKEKGIKRVVPARELSLEEITEIKNKTSLDIETFVHGALCYGYSGQCLFSSFLGGRSGNRGRCAGPCRLPYTVTDNNGKSIASDSIRYPLSLKDLCTIDNIPDLIEAGIDSFKIEGRLKSPYYVAGVTGLYRKYIDAYYAGGNTHISEEDRELLTHLYLRSGICDGYYHRHNGADMITALNPSYNTHLKEADQIVEARFLKDEPSCKVSMSARLKVGMPMELVVRVLDMTVSVKGSIVEAATKRPVTEADIIKQLKKLGGTGFEADTIEVDMNEECFIPLGAINELRRTAVEKLKDELLKQYKRSDINADRSIDVISSDADADVRFDIFIRSAGQLKATEGYVIDRLCMPYDMLYSGAADSEYLERRINDGSIKELFLVLPRIIRKRDDDYLKALADSLKSIGYIDGAIVYNLDELQFLEDIGFNNRIVCDSTLYGWNRGSHSVLSKYGECVAPLELSLHEINDIGDRNLIIPVYGHTSLMISANCIAKTVGKCTGRVNDFTYRLLDRYRKSQYVYNNCLHCYSELFNNVPTSYHKRFDDIMKRGYRHYKLEFTVEDNATIRDILAYYINNERGREFPVSEFTTGHIEKGAV